MHSSMSSLTTPTSRNRDSLRRNCSWWDQASKLKKIPSLSIGLLRVFARRCADRFDISASPACVQRRRRFWVLSNSNTC